ncbi:MAG: efflux RND transporter periplasmic adaptor subunit [Planctomycetota bacterium]
MTQWHRHKLRQGKITLVILMLLILLGGGVYAYYATGGNSPEDSQNEIILEQVTRGPFDHIVREQGEVESSSNIDINCEVETRGGGGTSILWVIEEGTYVKKGEKLIELDSSSLENEIISQRINLASADATVISSAAAVKTAEISLQEYLEGTYLSERKTLLSEVALAQQELRKAELSLESAERLAAKGVIKELQIEAEEFSVVNAKNKLEAAEAKLKVLDELTKEKNKVQFESDIEAAKARLKSDESVLAEEKAKLADIEDQIKKCVIYSPDEGVVVYNNRFSSRGGAEFVVEEGASVRERQTILKLPDPTKMQVKADVNESRITLIAEGMAAKVKVGAVPGEMLARVMRVNKYAEPGSWFNSAVKEYATFIEIINPPGTIRTGMTAEVRIFVAQLPDALQIPVHGVYEYKGHHFCLKKGDEQKPWVTVEIEIGATNDSMVTIDKGLAEGDSIALNPRQHLDLMEFPDIEEVSDREKLREIGKDAGKPSKPTPGQTGGRGGGSGGYGGMNVKTIVDSLFAKSDKDGDGKIAGDEINSLDSRMKDKVKDYDTNKDGALDKQEVIKVFNKFMGGGGGAGRQGAGGTGGRGGPPGR